MFHKTRSCYGRPLRGKWLLAVIIPLALALAPLLQAQQALAQSPRRQTRLEVLTQQNAVQQQQSAMQTAVQQTTVLVQTAYQSFRQQSGVSIVGALQAQQNALQLALQQTTALLQKDSRSNSALAQTALRQQNALQTALQQSLAVQATLSFQGGQLTDSQTANSVSRTR